MHRAVPGESRHLVKMEDGAVCTRGRFGPAAIQTACRGIQGKFLQGTRCWRIRLIDPMMMSRPLDAPDLSFSAMKHLFRPAIHINTFLFAEVGYA